MTITSRPNSAEPPWDLIREHLDVGGYGGGGRHSTLVAALLDARGATGREGATGAVVDPRRSQSWLGAVGYLLLIDQIGSTFGSTRPAGRPTGVSNPFMQALSHFTSLPSKHRWALYSLRCSLAHNYSLFSFPPRPEDRRNQLHAFRLTANELPVGQVVQLPEQPWSGDFAEVDDKRCRTVVDLRNLGDLVEQMVCGELVEQLALRTLTLTKDPTDFERHFCWKASPT